MPQSDLSMFDKITTLDQTTKEHADKHKATEARLEKTEEKLDEHAVLLDKYAMRLIRLEDQTIKLENTIMTENRDTRATVVEQNRQLFTLIESVMGFKSGEDTRKHDLKVRRWDSMTNIILKLAGAGGLIYLVAQAILGSLK